eukprot:11723649-Karenia_brevis.AAC.1
MDPLGEWQTIGQGAITGDGSSTRAELLALALLHCAVARMFGMRIPCPEIWHTQLQQHPDIFA